MAVINVAEDVSVKKVRDFHAKLRDVMESDDDDELVLDFSALKRVDLAVMQVLLAARRECTRGRKKMKIRSVSKEMKNQMRICGMIK